MEIVKAIIYIYDVNCGMDAEQELDTFLINSKYFSGNIYDIEKVDISEEDYDNYLNSTECKKENYERFFNKNKE